MNWLSGLGLVFVLSSTHALACDVNQFSDAAEISEGRCAAIVILERDGRILLGERLRNGMSEGWGFVGGKAEISESIEEALKREAREEVGLEIEGLKLIAQKVDPWSEAGPTEVFVFHARIAAGQPQILEPHKMRDLRWFRVHELPDPLFRGNREFVDLFLAFKQSQ